MKSSLLALCAFASLLAACGDSKVPPSQSGNRDGSTPLDGVAPLDGVSPGDAPAADGDDVAPGDDAAADGAVTDGATPDDAADGAMTDGARPDGATSDGPSDVPTDSTSPTPGLCMWSHGDLANFAVRMGLCTFRPPQEALNEYFRPDSWEGGSLSARACPALHCVATTVSGTCGDWLSTCLKYTVTRTSDGTCPTPAQSCDGTPPRAALRCASGVQTRDDCSAVGQRCAASGGAAACVPTMGDACAAGAPARCNGTVLEQCTQGVYTPARNCALTGGVCDASAGTCRGAGPECTGSSVECDGTSLRVCRGGRWHSIDCGRLVTGASCQTVNGHAFCGIDHECDPAAAAPNGSCDGNTLVLCAAGRTWRYVCEPRNGFNRCETGVGCVR